MSQRPPYRGPRRKLVLAFDVGTTYSGVSYAVLDPGQIPEIRPVTRFPANELISGASKIPTVIYYDRAGKVKAAGAEAMRDGIYETAEDEGWIKTEWFKLHLRPKSLASQHITQQIPPLPVGKTVVQVFADFLKYLHDCAAQYIKDTHANGHDVWRSIEKNIDYVLSHPNGWEGAQQDQMRRAAVLAGLVPDNQIGYNRIAFVTEGEASLHFSIHNGLPAGAMTRGDGVVIVDAGGGTIDVSAYGRSRNAGSAFDEIAAPQCHFHGSLFVSIHARVFLDKFLAESEFFDDLDHIIRCFDRTTKLRFRSTDDPQYIKFGSTRDNEPAFNIRFGQLKLQGSDVAMFFEPSVKCIINAVLEQRKSSHRPISHVIVVGGFAASDWLFLKAQEGLRAHGLNVIRPENHVNKAVSDGAISFYLDHYVNTRVSKMVYGNFCHIPYNENDPEHRQRPRNVFTSVSGGKRISESFDVILAKNVLVSETKEFHKPYFRESEDRNEFKKAVFTVWGYRGSDPHPRWKDVDTQNYTQMCTIEVDLSRLTLQPKHRDRGGVYYRLDYEIILLFGMTELKAQIGYWEKGVEKRSPAKIIYDNAGR